MISSTAARTEEHHGFSDEDVIARVRAGEIDLFEILMRRYNQRVYRLARAVLRNDAEAEDVVQDAWVRAYSHLGQFAGRAAFSTWISRIALHEAWARVRRRSRFASGLPDAAGETPEMKQVSRDPDPEGAAVNGEVRTLLESVIEELPETYRTVFVLREIEELSTAETAASLDVTEETVKTRLHRARAVLRRELLSRAGSGMRQAFPFLGPR
ncbi:MAG TPA: RNA polymerase sigma factor, partial [Thermoanaerobaculia bacterium]|nr:RNA polymerase sigma factor [Thermoanaerobaculia bacterium]